MIRSTRLRRAGSGCSCQECRQTREAAGRALLDVLAAVFPGGWFTAGEVWDHCEAERPRAVEILTSMMSFRQRLVGSSRAVSAALVELAECQAAGWFAGGPRLACRSVGRRNLRWTIRG